ncbi:MAG TPA: glycosyltransferase [Candidatus Polarisedimenticolia bacterium]|jgi:glycosyltransferase involved in cell wall biosynthesis
MKEHSTSAVTVLFVCDFNAHGGTQTHLLHLFRSLDRVRVRPWLAALTVDADLSRRLAELDIEVSDMHLRGALNPRTMLAIGGLAVAARRRRVDLVHGYLYQGNIMAAAVSRLTGAPCVTSVRNLDIWKSARHRFASSLAHRRAARVLFNSEAVRDQVVKRERIDRSCTLVIPNGVPRPVTGEPGGAGPPLAWLEERAGPTIVCVASLRSKKGHTHLLEAFRRVRSRVPEAGLLLLGDGPLRGPLALEASRPDLDGAVFFAGHRADVASILSRCDLFALSSLEEGMPNALLEAMAAGLPSVVTRVGGTAEVVEEGSTGYLVPPGDPAALAARLTELLLDPDLRRRQGEAARRRLESSFSLEKMTTAYHALYDDVLGRAGR